MAAFRPGIADQHHHRAAFGLEAALEFPAA